MVLPIYFEPVLHLTIYKGHMVIFNKFIPIHYTTPPITNSIASGAGPIDD